MCLIEILGRDAAEILDERIFEDLGLRYGCMHMVSANHLGAPQYNRSLKASRALWKNRRFSSYVEVKFVSPSPWISLLVPMRDALDKLND